MWEVKAKEIKVILKERNREKISFADIKIYCEVAISVTVQSSEKFRSAGGSRPVVGLAKGRPCQQGSWLAGSRPARVGQCVSGTRRGLPYPSLAEPCPSASRPSLLIPVLTALPVGGEPPIHAQLPGASLSWMVSLVPRCPPCPHRRRGVWGPE